MIGRLAFNKLNRAIARDETARLREEKQAVEQALHDEARLNFLQWIEQVGEEHPLVVQTAAELEKVENALSMTAATKTRRVNAIFSNAWSLAETNYNAVANVAAPGSRKIALPRAVVGILMFVGVAMLLAIAASNTKEETRSVQSIAPVAETTTRVEPVEIRKAVPVEIRKAIPVAAVKLGSDIDYSAENAAAAAAADKGSEGGHYTISSTGKRHNDSCRYYGKGRATKRKEGIACKICGG
jgi:hypothetical protein